jgi:hypothetical protein
VSLLVDQVIKFSHLEHCNFAFHCAWEDFAGTEFEFSKSVVSTISDTAAISISLSDHAEYDVTTSVDITLVRTPDSSINSISAI